jgi:hypothetical protein
MTTNSLNLDRRLDDIGALDPSDTYDRLGVAAWSDAELVAAAGSVLAHPKDAPADSFVLHAPLELMARAALLGRVRPEGRERARQRIVELAAAYQAAGDPVDRPTPVSFDSVTAAASRLTAVLAAGDLDEIDRVAAYLGEVAPPARMASLVGPPVVTSLGAAGHGGILLYLLARDPAGGVDGRVIRGALREIGRHPDWQLTWFADPDLVPGADDPHRRRLAASGPAGLVEALADVPLLGVPGSAFIFPIMNQAEASGTAAHVLAPLLDRALREPADPSAVWAARVGLARLAAWSMLQEGPEYAPYGWSHCLTMPQGVTALAGAVDPTVAVAVAATHVVGFRSAMGTGPLDLGWEPQAPALGDLVAAIETGREAAVSTAWHAPPGAFGGFVADLATNAAGHHDAHLVKYTLACLDAATSDPDNRRLYLAAAASLAAWWAADDRARQ